MLTFSLDTALQACSVAILRDGEVVFEEFRPLAKGHAEILPVMARNALRTANVDPARLDRIGVVVGPGGFTGVRVGLAFARGLAVGTKARVIGVNTLTALARSHKAAPRGFLAPCVDARRGEVFAALFGAQMNAILPPFAASPDKALAQLIEAARGAPLTIVGNGGPLLPLSDKAIVEATDLQIDPVIVARAAEAASPPFPDAPPGPIYLRAPDAKPSAATLFADPEPDASKQ